MQLYKQSSHCQDVFDLIDEKSVHFVGSSYICIHGLLEKYPTFGREKETGLLGALDT